MKERRKRIAIGVYPPPQVASNGNLLSSVSLYCIHKIDCIITWLSCGASTPTHVYLAYY
jgi:hypothetical protein